MWPVGLSCTRLGVSRLVAGYAQVLQLPAVSRAARRSSTLEPGSTARAAPVASGVERETGDHRPPSVRAWSRYWATRVGVGRGGPIDDEGDRPRRRPVGGDRDGGGEHGGRLCVGRTDRRHGDRAHRVGRAAEAYGVPGAHGHGVVAIGQPTDRARERAEGRAGGGVARAIDRFDGGLIARDLAAPVPGRRVPVHRDRARAGRRGNVRGHTRYGRRRHGCRRRRGGIHDARATRL